MPSPTNPLVRGMFTDKYELTMAYAYYSIQKHQQQSVFNDFFRKCPFGGEFAIFNGLEETLRYLETLRFTGADIDYLQHGHLLTLDKQLSDLRIAESFGQVKFDNAGSYQQLAFRADDKGELEECWQTLPMPTADIFFRPGLPNREPGFYDWLAGVDGKSVTMRAMREGTFCFPREPLIQAEGELAVVQMMETAQLNLTNFATLATTEAFRFRLAAGFDKYMMEFGARRAQGPDGALTASRSAYIGSFDGTSNMLAGQLYGLETAGTMAHSFVTSMKGLQELPRTTLVDVHGEEREFVQVVLRYRRELKYDYSDESELSSFIGYAQAFPDMFLALVDTIDTLLSGVPNFICVALALREFGYNALGVRLDSGDLAYLSRATRAEFRRVEEIYPRKSGTNLIPLYQYKVVSGNDLTVASTRSLREQGDESDTHGIGTNLVTCSEQSALGGVDKLEEVDGEPCIKLSNESSKTTIPGAKRLYRLYGQDGKPLDDLMTLANEAPPQVGESIMACHPNDESKRAVIIPSRVEDILLPVWDKGRRTGPEIPVDITRKYVLQQYTKMRRDHLRDVNPTPYKVSVSPALFDLFHGMILKKSRIRTLS